MSALPEWIAITKGKWVQIDAEDYARIAPLKWQAVSPNGINYYARRTVQEDLKIKNVYMHNLILGIEDQIDHKNGDGLDNRKENLRICTQSQNRMNCRKGQNQSSKYKGVSWHKKNKRWRAYIQVNGKKIALGNHVSEELAAKAYNDAAEKHFGEWACLNVITALGEE